MRPAGRAIPFLILALILALLPRIAAAQPRAAPPDAGGRVTLPLARWEGMQGELQKKCRAGEPCGPGEGAALWIERRLEGRFDKGLWTGRLTGRFEVPAGSDGRVSVLDAGAILGEVTVDGAPAALLPSNGLFNLLTQAPGRHEIAVDFRWGRESQRFTRSLRLRLPEGGPTRVKARIAERDVEASLAGGALTAAAEEGGDTVVVGQLDGTGALDLSWRRRAEDGPRGEAKMTARQHTLFTVSEAITTGTSAVEVQVVEGEADTVSLTLPRGVEVVRVEGEAVLQWRTTLAADERGKLRVLLRHLVADAASFRVDFQLPGEAGAPLELRMPAPDAPTSGAIGVLGPPGLSVQATQAEGAEPLAARDLPGELLGLTESPVLFGYRFAGEPRVVLAVSRLAALELTTTLVDELQASTVLLDDGAERTKVKLHIRNSARQYVEITLPEGATLTHSFIDGREVRPATRAARASRTSRTSSEGALLFPLRQSERLEAGEERIHVVRPGETLSDVANLYYSDPSAWSRILGQNRDVVGESGALTRGAKLKIPPLVDARGAAGKEASFVVELAYERASGPLGALGRRALRLPGLDVEAVKAIWHVYLPGSYEPLSFAGNLTQCSRIKYDPFRRIEWYLQHAIDVPMAWAGDDYESILTKRRAIYDAEAGAEEGGGAALTSFPLVGERYRFRRILLGREVPEIRVTYASATVVAAARHAALLLSLGVTLWALLRGRGAPGRWLVAAVALGGLLVVAHHVSGVHRRIVWGIDLALLLALVRVGWPRLRRAARIAARAPWRAARAVTPRRLIAAGGFTWALGIVASYPMILSLAALAGMAIAWWRLHLPSPAARFPRISRSPEAGHAR